MQAKSLAIAAGIILSLNQTTAISEASNLTVVEVKKQSESPNDRDSSSTCEKRPGTRMLTTPSAAPGSQDAQTNKHLEEEASQKDLPAALDSGSKAQMGKSFHLSADQTRSVRNQNKLLEDHDLLLPSLVPYKDEILLQNKKELNQADFAELSRHCVLLRKDCGRQSIGLYRGRLLLDCQSDLKVRLPDAELKIARGAVVYIYSTGESQVILNLHDHRRRDVEVKVGKDLIELPPGREILITRHHLLQFEQARLVPGIWFRSVYLLKDEPGLKVYETQFSSISAVALLPALRKLVKEQKSSREKLAKTFAAVITVSGDRQAFRPSMQEPNTQKSSKGILKASRKEVGK